MPTDYGPGPRAAAERILAHPTARTIADAILCSAQRCVTQGVSRDAVARLISARIPDLSRSCEEIIAALIVTGRLVETRVLAIPEAPHA